MSVFRKRYSQLLTLASILFTAIGGAAAPKPSGNITLEMVGEDVISTNQDEFGAMPDNDWSTLYFDRSIPAHYHYVMYVSHQKNGKWSTPEILPFSGQYRDSDPVISSDGKTLYFVSDRPAKGLEPSRFHAWAADRTGSGWTNLHALKGAVNEKGNTEFISFAANGNMASLIHFNLDDPGWVIPDRNTIPHNVPFFQNLRELMPEICHKRGVLAIGGMTALYPSREDAELNERALTVLQKDKKNEAECLMDGAWTGHPDQNQIALDQFPLPNQLSARRPSAERYPDLRPQPSGIGQRTLAGTRAAVRTVIRYRNGVLNGRGASLLDGYMEDLATDRIYRLMIAQRLRHSDCVPIEIGRAHV